MSKHTTCNDCGEPIYLHTCADGPEGLCEIAALRRVAMEAVDLLETWHCLLDNAGMWEDDASALEVKRVIARLRGKCE
jgi:hypothetical protein